MREGDNDYVTALGWVPSEQEQEEGPKQFGRWSQGAKPDMMEKLECSQGGNPGQNKVVSQCGGLMCAAKSDDNWRLMTALGGGGGGGGELPYKNDGGARCTF